MMYLGIEQHACQLMISFGDESGNVIQARHTMNAVVDCRAIQWTGAVPSNCAPPGFFALHEHSVT